MTLTAAGNLLLSNLTTEGTGVLQFPAATTSAGGITFGTDTNLYRIGAGQVTINSTGTNPNIALSEGGTAKAYFQTSSGTCFIDTTGASSIILRPQGVAALTLDSSQNATFAATLRMSTDAVSGAGAISVTKDTTKLTSTGSAQAITLANGTDGQIKRIIHDVDGGSMVLTPTTKTGWSTATFTNAGDSLTLEYVTTRGWIVMSNYGTVIAP